MSLLLIRISGFWFFDEQACKFSCFSFGDGFFVDIVSGWLCKGAKISPALLASLFGSRSFGVVGNVRLGSGQVAEMTRSLSSKDLVSFVRTDGSSLFPLPCSESAQPNRSLACVLGSYAFCQLLKFESCAIIFSRWRERLAPVRVAGVHEGSPTMRAPDLGYAPRFSSFFPAVAGFRFEGLSTLPPQAGNAHR